MLKLVNADQLAPKSVDLNIPLLAIGPGAAKRLVPSFPRQFTPVIAEGPLVCTHWAFALNPANKENTKISL